MPSGQQLYVWAGGLRATRFFCRLLKGKGQAKVTRGRSLAARKSAARVARKSAARVARTPAAHTPVGNVRHHFVHLSPPQPLCAYTEKQVSQRSHGVAHEPEGRGPCSVQTAARR